MLRRYSAWVDLNGATRLTYVNGNATLSGVLTQLVAASNADVLNYVEGAFVLNPVFPPGGLYRSVEDAAVLTFTDAASNLVDITLPAPLANIFMADTVTVDPAQIAAIIAAVVGTVETAAGGVVTAYVGGIRTTKRGVV